MANELTNIYGKDLQPRCPLDLLASLIDKKQQHRFTNAISQDLNRSSFLIDHNTGISISRDESQSEIVYVLCRDWELERVPADDAILACEVFWDLRHEHQITEPAGRVRRHDKKPHKVDKRKPAEIRKRQGEKSELNTLPQAIPKSGGG